MSCGAPLWIVYVVKGVLFIAGFLSIVLMQRAEKDQSINRIDSKNLRNARRISFIAITGFAWATSIALTTDIGLFAFLLLVLSTCSVMVVDILALDHRPPNSGLRRYPIEQNTYIRRSFPLRIISIFRKELHK